MKLVVTRARETYRATNRQRRYSLNVVMVVKGVADPHTLSNAREPKRS